MKKRIFLWSTIYEKLLLKGVKGFEIDIRYLQRYIREFPDVFPKFMREYRYLAYFNWKLYRWEIQKTN